MANYCDITVLLDRSGSMESIKSAMESGYKEFLQQHRQVPSSKLTLIQFDSDNAHEVVHEAMDIALAPPLNLSPRGGTPLLDALCRAIDGTGERLKNMPEGERPDRVLFVIITDGQENQSREFKREHVRERIARQMGVYKWQFVYLGANQDAFAEAASFGIPRQYAATYAANNKGSQNIMRAMASNTVSYTSGASARLDCFTPDQLEKALEEDEKVGANS